MQKIKIVMLSDDGGSKDSHRSVLLWTVISVDHTESSGKSHAARIARDSFPSYSHTCCGYKRLGMIWPSKPVMERGPPTRTISKPSHNICKQCVRTFVRSLGGPTSYDTRIANPHFIA